MKKKLRVKQEHTCLLNENIDPYYLNYKTITIQSRLRYKNFQVV